MNDLTESSVFYENVMGFEKFQESDRGCGFLLPGGSILLLIKQGTTLKPNKTPGGVIPSCGATGSMHVSFKISLNALETWRVHLENHGVVIESQVDFEFGGKCLYFRDPDGHLLELSTPGVWEVY